MRGKSPTEGGKAISRGPTTVGRFVIETLRAGQSLTRGDETAAGFDPIGWPFWVGEGEAVTVLQLALVYKFWRGLERGQFTWGMRESDLVPRLRRDEVETMRRSCKSLERRGVVYVFRHRIECADGGQRRLLFISLSAAPTGWLLPHLATPAR